MLNLLLAISLTLASPSSGPETRTASEDAIRAYDELRSMRRSERARVLAQMPGSTQAGVWTHHLLTTLVNHPEFTTEQRAVIQEALLRLTPELFEIDPSNPRWSDIVDLPLRRLKERAMAAFPDKTFVGDLFTRLGPESGLSQPPSGRPRLIQTNSETCSCSVTSDWCDTGFECLNTWCVFTSSGCGTLLRYPCDGRCFMKAH
jgi:hypothetical protein